VDNPSNYRGNTQVWIDIVDVQGNVASAFTSFWFRLFKPGIHPLDLIPYVAGAAAESQLCFLHQETKEEKYLRLQPLLQPLRGEIPQGTHDHGLRKHRRWQTLLTEQLM